MLGRLTVEISEECESRLPEKWLWRGRRVHLVDGTTVSMPDTPTNQAAYPQHTVQKEGLGFPIARMVVLMSLATAMLGKEIWTALLAYNLIRRCMLQAAAESNRSPRQLSFTAALQKIAACWLVLLQLDEERRIALITRHLSGLLHNRVGHRPDRVEPRAIKRRPKPHKLLTKPRKQARADLLAGNST